MTDEYVGGLGEAIVAWFYLGLMAYNHKETIFNFLDSKILQFFGKISYSLYLIHFSVLYIFAKIVLDYLPNLPYTQNYLAFHLMFFVISTILATYLSIFMNKFVEEPSVKLASFISEKFKRWTFQLLS